MPYLLQARNQIVRMRDPSDGVMYELHPGAWAFFGDKPESLKELDRDVRFKPVAEANGHERGVVVKPKPQPAAKAAEPKAEKEAPTLIQRRGAKAEENIKKKRRGRPRKVPL